MAKSNHEHQWNHTYGLSFRIVRRCVSCGAVESLVFDYDQRKRVWVNGNLYDDSTLKTKVHLFTGGDPSEFLQASEVLLESNQLLEKENIHNASNVNYLIDKYQRIPFILAGSWTENPSIQDPMFVELINKFMFGE